MDKTILEEFNHWWTSGSVDPELALPFKRDIYADIGRNMDKRFIIAIVGLRRVGKTTIMYQLIQKLIKENVNRENILFFSFDESAVNLGEVLRDYKELQNKNFRDEKVYIFLDEIQKCSNWENEVKKYYDLYPKIKFVISGSESLFIRKRTKENMAGRIFEFNLSTFAFKEYLRMHGVKENQFKYETNIKPYFLKYVRKGGFPETFSFDNDKDFREYVRALIIDKVIYKDIPKLFKIEDPELVGNILHLIAINPGMYIDYQSLGKQFGKDRRVIKNYLFYLRESFLITMLGNYRKGGTSLRKRKRAYPTDNALIYLYKPRIDDHFFGKMVETMAVNKLKAVSFWKNSSEIDIVHNGVPIEVKYQENIKSSDFKPIKEFAKKFRKKSGIIITKTDDRQIKVDGIVITFMPFWKWLLS